MKLILTTAAVLAISALSCAQTGPVRTPHLNRPELGALDGFVSGADEVALVGVVVVAGSDHDRLVTVTDEAGRYVFASLPSGPYRVEFDPCQAGGVTKPVNVAGNSVTSLDATIDDGGDVDARPDTLDVAPGTVRLLDTAFASIEPTVATMQATVSAVTGAIHGTVLDSVSLRPIEGVTIVISSPSVQGAYSAITDSAGRYTVGQLAPGTYSVTLYFGTTTLRGNNIVVHPNKITGLDQLMDIVKATGDTLVLDGIPVVSGGDGLETIHDYIDSIPVPAEQFAQTLLSGGSAHGVVFATPRVTVEMAVPEMPERGLTGVDADEVWIIAKADAPTTTAPPTSRRRHYGSGQMCAYVPATKKTVALPIKSTDVYAKIVANAAGVEVEQSYHNPNTDKIEALYVFPLPENAAISDFVMTVGKRRIRGIIRERDEAIKLYDEARQAGYVASLLTQARPNIFTHQIANIDPGKDIDIKLSYYNLLPYRDGAYSFVFPTVVGPRHNPPEYMQGVGAVARGDEGKSGQPIEVSYLAPNETSGHRISITVDIDAGVEIDSVDSDTHSINSVELSTTQRRVTLAKGAMIPDRDYALSYSVKGDARTTGALVYEHKGEKYFTLVLHPPAAVTSADRTPVELVLVVDTSGSMEGLSLEAAKRAASRLLERLSGDDTFRIIGLSAKTSSLAKVPLLATSANITKGLEYIENLGSSGGTALSDGIGAALGGATDDERLRVVALMTDGYVGDEDALLEVVHDRLGDARLFGIGIGAAVNRHLLESVSSAGRGAVAYLGYDVDRADEVVDDLGERITHPAMTDIELDFGGMHADEVYPTTIPDLYIGRPIVVTGRLDGTITDGTITVRGLVGTKRVTDTVSFDADSVGTSAAVAKIWARMKIADLTRRAVYSSDAAAIRKQIRKVAATHGIASAHTGFVAVDSATRTDDTQAMSVTIPASVPAGVRYDKAIDEQ